MFAKSIPFSWSSEESEHVRQSHFLVVQFHFSVQPQVCLINPNLGDTVRHSLVFFWVTYSCSSAKKRLTFRSEQIWFKFLKSPSSHRQIACNIVCNSEQMFSPFFTKHKKILSKTHPGHIKLVRNLRKSLSQPPRSSSRRRVELNSASPTARNSRQGGDKTFSPPPPPLSNSGTRMVGNIRRDVVHYLKHSLKHSRRVRRTFVQVRTISAVLDCKSL